MTDNGIYETIKQRCSGDIYIGVVGPVRSGKSTFIRRFLDCMVLPNIENEFDKGRTMDEIPQSGSGRTITTTEPKFTPADAVEIRMGTTKLNAKMIDCVGYMIDGAAGATEDGEERMVMTPWSSEPMPFTAAAELGTQKVIREHSTIAVLVTTDGTICDIPRESYVSAEERIVNELKAEKKPFAIILNSQDPQSDEATALATALEEKYSAPVALLNCTRINEVDAREILRLAVGEFPIKELCFTLPEWCAVIPKTHPMMISLKDKISSLCSCINKLSDTDKPCASEAGFEKVMLDAGVGTCKYSVPLTKDDYYTTMSELTGIPLQNEKELFAAMIELSSAKRDYDKIKQALADTREKGYGIVMPSSSELSLSEPELVRRGNGYGIKVCAAAEAIHMIKTEIKAEICPVVGTAEQSTELIEHMSAEYEENPEKLLESKMFGRSLYDLVSDGVNSKIMHITDESREKLCKTLEKIVNEGSSGLICILL